MRGNSKMSFLMGKGPFSGRIADLTEGDGTTEKYMDTECSPGRMGTSTRGNTFTVKSKEKEHSIGTMARCSWGSG